MAKLNIGCGKDIKVGWVNLDYHSLNGADFIHDLNNLPLPFKDNTFSYIYCSHVLEDFINAVDILIELVRVTTTGGIIEIRVPNETIAWSNIHHKKAFNIKSFKYFSECATYGRHTPVKILTLCYYGLTEESKGRVNIIGRLYFAVCVAIANSLPLTVMCETFVRHLFPRLNILVRYQRV